MSTNSASSPMFTLTISSNNAASISAQFTGDPGPGCSLTLNTNLANPEAGIDMVSGTTYGPYTQYYPNPSYPDNNTNYAGGQVTIIMGPQQCGPGTNAYQTAVFIDTDDNGNLQVWAFNAAMTPARQKRGPLAQFATFTAAYGSNTTTPSATSILTTAIGLGATIKTIKNGVGNWNFDNGQCFTVNFQIQSSFN